MSQLSHIAEPLRSLAEPIESITADPANLRIHDDRSVEAIAASLRRFGQQKPIVIDAAGVTIAGAGVLAAARKIGWTHLAVVRSDLSGTDRTLYGIADNRTPELSAWDKGALAQALPTFSLEDLAAAGFSAVDVAELVTPDEALRDDNPEVEFADPVSKPGDLWSLGEHRILCGNSTLAADVDRVMGGEKAVMVQTDPPYLVDYSGKRPGATVENGSGKDWSALYKEIPADQAVDFYTAIFANVVRVLAPKGAIYCWHADKRFPDLMSAWKANGILHHQNVIWVKPSSIMGRVMYHFRHEPCAMGWIEGSMPKHDRANVGYDSVWELDFDGRGKQVGNEHPTQKPLEIFARPLRRHTRVGDVVFEPFSGSGSQLIACEQLGRRCRAIELEPVFVDVAIRRWQRLTGREATLADTTTTWGQVAAQRGVTTQR